VNSRLMITIVASVVPMLAFAQSILFDPEKLAAACRSDTCQVIVAETVQHLQSQNLEAEQFNSQLGIVAAVLLETAREMAGENPKHVVNALTDLAEYSTDRLQQDAFRNVAQALSRADPSLLTPSEAFAVSPDRPGRRPGRRRNGRGRPRFLGIF